MALSPLLLSAARPPALDSLSATCRLEDAANKPAQTAGTNVSYRRAAGGQAGSSTQAGAAGNEATSFVRDRWNAIRQLIRENPYFSHATPEQQAQAEALCLAQIKADYEVLFAQAATSDQPQIQPLPDLGTSSGGLTGSSPANPDSPANPATPALDNNGVKPAPAIPPVTSPAIPPVTSPETSLEPAVRPTAAPTPQPPAVDPPTLPVAQDPSTYMGPEANPTPFDGTVIKTLSDFPDGNYRYISGAAEERAYSNEELRQRGGSVFVLKKVGDTVTGDLLPRIGVPGICVTGTVNGDVITGAAYPQDTTGSQRSSIQQIGENYEPYSNGALKIRRTRTEGSRPYYAGALLDLTEFTPINAGTSLPPASCQTGRTGGENRG